MDCSQRFKLSRSGRLVLHFAGLRDIFGEIAQATMTLHIEAKDDKDPLPLLAMQTDPPPLLLGGAGLPPDQLALLQRVLDNTNLIPAIV